MFVNFYFLFLFVFNSTHCVESVHIRSYLGPHFYRIFPHLDWIRRDKEYKVSVVGVILVRIFPHLDWIRRDTEYLSVFSPNAGKGEKNADQNNSKWGHFLRIDWGSFYQLVNLWWFCTTVRLTKQITFCYQINREFEGCKIVENL